MKWRLFVLSLLFAAGSASAGNEALIYTVQLVRGTDQKQPPEQGAKAVSAAVGERLGRFRWKHYWEIRREAVPVTSQRPAKLQLSKDRGLGLELVGEDHVEMHLYRDGKLVRTARQKIQSDSYEIMGGHDKDDSWFVVVRRKPH